MTVLSKLAGQFGFRILTYNCYEVGHPWNESCISTSSWMAVDAFKDSAKIYATFYALTLLLRRQKLKEIDFRRLFWDWLRSSIFLTNNAFWFIAFLCLFRHSLGFFIFPTVGLINGFIASLIAILIERKTRRGMLALYMLQIATELAYNMAVDRNLISAIPYGDVLMFAVTMGIYMYLYEKGSLNDSASNAIRFVYGFQRNHQHALFDICDSNTTRLHQKDTFLWVHLNRLPMLLRHCIDYLRSGSASCLTHEYSCASYCVEGFLRNFIATYVMSSSVSVITSIPRLFNDISVIWSSLFNRRSLHLALFMSCLALSYKIINCAFARYRVKDLKRHFLAGFISGLSSIFYPHSSVAQYLSWKLAEILFFKGVAKGYWPKFANADVLLYSCATAFVLHAGVFEPHCIRPAYWKFLISITGKKILYVYRYLIDVWGCDSSRFFKDYRPVLNTKLTTFNPVLMP